PFIYWLPYVFLGIAFARGFPLAPRWLLLAAFVLLAAPVEMAHLVQVNGLASPYLLSGVIVGSTSLLLVLGPRPRLMRYSRAPGLQRCVESVQYIGRHRLAIFVGSPFFLLAAKQVAFLPDQVLCGLLGKVVIVSGAVLGSLWVGWALRRLGLGILVGA